MSTALAKERLRDLFSETLLTLCRSNMITDMFPNFKVEALIGLTLHSSNKEDDVILININQDIKSGKAKHKQTPTRTKGPYSLLRPMGTDYTYMHPVPDAGVPEGLYTQNVSVTDPSGGERIVKVEQCEPCDLSTPPRGTPKSNKEKKSIDKVVEELSEKKEGNDKSEEATPTKNDCSSDTSSEKPTPMKARSSKRKAMPMKNMKTEHEQPQEESSTNIYAAFSSAPVFPGHDFNDNTIDKFNGPAGRPVTPTHQEPMEHDVDYSPDNIQFLTTYGSGNQQVYPNPELLNSDSSPEDMDRFRKLSPGKTKLAQRQLRMYACKQCNKTFNHSSHLKDHIRIHTGEKPFACQVCRKGFRQKQHLKKHLQVHKEENAANQTENPPTSIDANSGGMESMTYPTSELVDATIT